MAGSSNVHLVVMAGGSGTRFWPKSTSKKPKQFLTFGSESKGSLLTQTVARFDGIVEQANTWVVTTAALGDQVKSQLEKIPAEQILLEPQGRNTAPAIYWAARAIASKNPKAVMLVMPSDHYVQKLDRFRSTVKMALGWATRSQDLVTLGIQPTRPETGYGYLKLGNAVEEPCRLVSQFVEKPSFERAQEFLKSGQYLWNGGMFVWKVETILAAFEKHLPEYQAIWEKTDGRVADAYPKMTATSIDYGVMEKASNVVTYSLDCGWDDLGSWISLESMADVLMAKRTGGTVTAGDLIAIDSDRNIVDAPGKCVALLGVNDLIVAQSGDSILVAQKSRAQDIRLVVDAVKKSKPELV